MEMGIELSDWEAWSMKATSKPAPPSWQVLSHCKD